MLIVKAYFARRSTDLAFVLAVVTDGNSFCLDSQLKDEVKFCAYKLKSVFFVFVEKSRCLFLPVSVFTIHRSLCPFPHLVHDR